MCLWEAVISAGFDACYHPAEPAAGCAANLVVATDHVVLPGRSPQIFSNLPALLYIVQHTKDRKNRFLLISLAVLGLDQWSKWWIEQNLAPYDRIEVIPGFFNLIYAQNTGIAFGLFPSRGEFLGTAILALLGLAALALVALLFVRTPSNQITLLLALALVLGGAVGNLTDRLMLGAVTDFLDVYSGQRHFPTFNIADSSITVGIVFLAWDSVFGGAATTSEMDTGSEAGA